MLSAPVLSYGCCKNRDDMTQKRTTYLNVMTVHSNPSPLYRCQTGNGTLYMVCVIVHTFCHVLRKVQDDVIFKGGHSGGQDLTTIRKLQSIANYALPPKTHPDLSMMVENQAYE